ncbi:hypothetical protein EJP617_D090 (plasmid) [Erwinia sp. Ejp617]|nr:hypothetical protein EJP617_D090 [Erwinia sp. Ejp617]
MACANRRASLASVWPACATSPGARCWHTPAATARWCSAPCCSAACRPGRKRTASSACLLTRCRCGWISTSAERVKRYRRRTPP